MLTLRCLGVLVLQIRFETLQPRMLLKLTATQGRGTAAILGIISISGELKTTGWRPLRTV